MYTVVIHQKGESFSMTWRAQPIEGYKLKIGSDNPNEDTKIVEIDNVLFEPAMDVFHVRVHDVN